jgi:hypothetical protein
MRKERLRQIRAAAERPFVRNRYGLWCPNCDEQIDELWPDACDYCGYLNKDYTRFDEEEDDYE